MKADEIFGVIKDGVPLKFVDDWDFIGKLGEGKLFKFFFIHIISLLFLFLVSISKYSKFYCFHFSKIFIYKILFFFQIESNFMVSTFYLGKLFYKIKNKYHKI